MVGREEAIRSVAVIKIDGWPPTCHLSISRASLVLVDGLVNGVEVWEIFPFPEPD